MLMDYVYKTGCTPIARKSTNEILILHVRI